MRLAGKGEGREKDERQNNMIKNHNFSYRPTDEAAAREFPQWKYEPAYEIYNCLPQYLEEDLVYHLDPTNNMDSIYRDGELVGFCSFGQDGRVAGGDFDEHALDIGLMIKP